MTITRNPDLDETALARAFVACGRGQIREIMTQSDAERTEAVLHALPWRMAFNSGGQVREVTPDRLAQLTPVQVRDIEQEVHAGAERGFQFWYHYHPIVEPYFAAPDKGPLASVFEWLNSQTMLDLIRRITGLADIRWADAHAAMYAPGQFLNNHDDLKPHLPRRAAYVLNFTRDWRNDWGGYLQFFDESGNVTGAFKPAFNALNMFTVPQEHSVGMVSPYARGRRYSITGWFRADAPPGPIG